MTRCPTTVSWLPLASALICLACVCMGCGNSTTVGTVSGKIEHGGKPIPTGHKVFFEGNGYIAAGVIQDDSTYTLNYKGSSGIPLGSYVVFVGPPAVQRTDSEFDALLKKAAAEYRSRGEKPPLSPDWVLPSKFYLSTTSPLRETVEAGENIINLSLDD